MYAPFRLPCAATRPASVWLLAIFAAFAAAIVWAPPANANTKYAGYVYDVVAGKALYSEHATAKRYPASLTKIMTVYIMFEELKAGRMNFGTRMRVSKYAAARPPSKIGFKPGGSIRVRDAIKALVTKSANDVAAVVAEHISGSEAAFAKRMTKTARRLGMKSTTFRNPHGLPNSRQTTTARDMAMLGIAIQRDFPQYYGVFQTRTFKFGKRNYRNHNRLLGTVQGVDGIKTGYIRASGFNLVTSVRRNGRHIVAVVMGGRTGASRNAQMKKLIARALPKAKRGKPMPIYAFNDSVPPPVPAAKPSMERLYAARFKATTQADAAGEAGAAATDPIQSQIVAFAAQTRQAIGPVSAYDPQTLTAVIAQASDAGLPTPAAPVQPAAIELASANPAQTLGATRSLGANRSLSAEPAAPTVATSDPDPRFSDAFDTFAQAPAPTLDRAALLAAIARARVEDLRTQRRTAPSAMTAPTPQPTANRTAKSNRQAVIVPAAAPQATVTGTNRQGWQIQLGAVSSVGEAEALLSSAAKKLPSTNGLSPVTEPVQTDRGTLYRARFAGFADQTAALAACQHFANHDRPCWATSM